MPQIDRNMLGKNLKKEFIFCSIFLEQSKYLHGIIQSAGGTVRSGLGWNSEKEDNSESNDLDLPINVRFSY